MQFEADSLKEVVVGNLGGAGDVLAKEVGKIGAGDGLRRVLNATGIGKEPALFGVFVIQIAKQVALIFARQTVQDVPA